MHPLKDVKVPRHAATLYLALCALWQQWKATEFYNRVAAHFNMTCACMLPVHSLRAGHQVRECTQNFHAFGTNPGLVAPLVSGS
jgi:hypothetical protein